MTTASDIITKLRKEIGGADPGTIYGDVLALCDAYEELAGQCDELLHEIVLKIGVR